MSFSPLAGAAFGVIVVALALAAIFALSLLREARALRRRVAALEGLKASLEKELGEVKTTASRLEKAMTEQQVAGGFGHEMRNALAGAKMLLGAALGPKGGDSLAAEDSKTLNEAIRILNDHGPEQEGRPTVAKLLKKVNSNEQQIDAILRDVDAALGRALTMTQVIMDYARLGRERPGTSKVALRPLCEAIVAESRGDLAAHQIEAAIEVDRAIVLTAKESHVYSIIKNLVLNARDALIEKEETDGRRIRIAAEEDAERCVLRVEDTGTGIAPENLQRIFDPFFSTKPRSGTGLGLGMVQKLVTLYEGTITVDSELRRGTTFVITLPRRAA